MKTAQIIAVANNKGGVGKTTTVACLGAALARHGRRTLLIDTDPQCSLTDSLVSGDHPQNSYTALTGPKNAASLAGIIIPGSAFDNPVENLDLIPSSPKISDLDVELNSRTSRERFLVKVIQTLRLDEKYDYILIDCPPALDMKTVVALTACTMVIVPTHAEILPLRGLTKLEDKCDEIVEDLNPGAANRYVLITRYNGGTNLSQSVNEVLEQAYGDKVFKTRIGINVRLAECPGAKKTIFDYDPSCKGAQNYEALSQEIMALEEA